MSNEKTTCVDISILKRIASLYDVEITRGWQNLLSKKMHHKDNKRISAWKKRGVPNEAIAEIALNKNVRKEWIETGRGAKYNQAAPYGTDPPEVVETATGYTSQPLTGEELHLVKLYRKMHPAEREKVVEIAELYTTMKESRENAGGGSDLKESNSK